MSANLVVDVVNTCQFHPSIGSPAVGTTSGAIVGLPIDLKNSDTYCNVWAVAGAGSGPVGILIQTTDTIASGYLLSGAGGPTSGSFTDPTSGLAGNQLPSNIDSGGILWINSGLWQLPGGGGQGAGLASSGGGATIANVNGALAGTFPQGTHPIQGGMGAGGYNTSGSWPVFASGGGMAWGAFLRPHRYARLVLISGASNLGNLYAGFATNLKTTGSGGGFAYGPTSGNVVV